MKAGREVTAGPLRLKLIRTLTILIVLLVAAVALGLIVGRQHIDFSNLLSDPIARTLFFRLRLPRVLVGLLTGASLALTGAALQALFRNPLADPYILGVSGGGVLGASVAIALGWTMRVIGVPLLYIASFGGAMLAVLLVKRIARAGAIVVPGALLLSGVVVNLVCAAAVLADRKSTR